MIIIGVDTGGTFTDFIYKEADRWTVLKRLSTPSNPAEAVLEGLRQIAENKRKQIVHGSTVATNAILERKGAKTALITNKGFTDVIEIGRQNRSRLYDLAYQKEPHIVPPKLRFGVQGRVGYTGEEIEELDTIKAEKIVQELKELEVESVAVSCHQIIGGIIEGDETAVSRYFRIITVARCYLCACACYTGPIHLLITADPLRGKIPGQDSIVPISGLNHQCSFSPAED